MSANSESEKFGFEISTPCPITNTERFELFKAGTPISFHSGSETIWLINPLPNIKVRFACGLCLTENANLAALGQHTKRCYECQLKKHNPDYVNKFVTEKLTLPCKSTLIPDKIKVKANEMGGMDGFNYLNEYLESKLTPQERKTIASKKKECKTRIALEEEKQKNSALRKELEQMKKKIADSNKDKGATANDSVSANAPPLTANDFVSANAPPPPFFAKAEAVEQELETTKRKKKKRKNVLETTKRKKKKKKTPALLLLKNHHVVVSN
ncbi:hypothetical protein FRACYDRAFT_271131, partial [Fragilariopsis cylindrus CCMP1102]